MINDFIYSYFNFLKKPEYIVLLVSVVAICVNVYISYKNRKYSLAKEEYFKLQQVVEKIIAKLLILNNQQAKLKTYIELTYKVSKSNNSLFIDSNDTFNKERFDKNGEEITAFIDIYFGDIGTEWNSCLEKMSGLYTHVFILSKNLENKTQIDWKLVVDTFNKQSLDLADKPKQIADKLKQELKDFKEEKFII